MIFARIILFLLQLANGIAARLDRESLVQSGVDLQIGAAAKELNRTLNVVLKIKSESSTPKSDIDELRRAGGA